MATIAQQVRDPAYDVRDNVDKEWSNWSQVRVVQERGRFYLRVNVVTSGGGNSNGVQFIKLESYEAEAFTKMGVRKEEKK